MSVRYDRDFSQPANVSKYLYELEALGADMAKNSGHGLSKFLVDKTADTVSKTVSTVAHAITPKRSSPSGPK